jgi:aminoglycoside phosphotransferase (APT) family kinase protein
LPTSSQDENSKLAQELEIFLRSKLGNSVAIAGELNRLQGGFDTDTLSFSIENAPAEFPTNLVLRYFRHANEAPRVIRESTIQNAAAKGGHIVPSVPIDSIGELLLNRPFLIMERLPGSNMGDLLISDQTVIPKFPAIMAKLQAGLHRLDTTNLRDHLAESGVNVEQMLPTRMLKTVKVIADAAQLPDLTEISSWLADSYPTQPDNPSIVHGDLHPMNILMHEGEVSGLIDWATSMFTHPEYDVAVSRTLLSIGPPEEIGIPKEELDKMLSWALGEYMKESHARQTLDDSLIDYYSVLRMSHAYAKVLGKRHNIDLPFISHEGYAWDRPDLYSVVTKVIGETTGIELVSA